MLMMYFLDVAPRTLNRLECFFATDAEGIQHSKELAAPLQHRHFTLMIAVLDQSSRKIHEEVVYPEGEQRT